MLLKTAVIKGCIMIYLGLSPVNAITLQVSRNPYLSVIYLDIGPMSVCDGTGEPSLFLRSSPHAYNRENFIINDNNKHLESNQDMRYNRLV